MTDKLEVKKREFPLKRGSNYYIKHGETELCLPAVTTILGDTLPKKQLIYWAAKTAAQSALENPAQSVEEATNSIYKKRDSAGNLGKTVHSWAESYGNGGVLDPESLPDDIKPFGKAFIAFMGTFQPEILFTECIVFNVTHGYAGTADTICKTKDGKIAICDYKTGKDVYFESHLQQEAYANAEFILTKDMKIIPMPKIEEKYLVHLKNTGTFSLVGVNEPFSSFLKVLEVFKILK